LPHCASSCTVVASLGEETHGRDDTRAREGYSRRSFVPRRTLAAKYAANVERALGREGMCEVSGIAMEVREMVEVMKDRTVLPL
jgi:hypothetical protein